MWEQVRALRAMGVTIILTTHYIEEAEEMADRIGVINKGKLIVTEVKEVLMQKMGKRQMVFILRSPMSEVPAALAAYNLILNDHGKQLIYTYNVRHDMHDVSELINDLSNQGIRIQDIESRKSSLEEIFIQLVA
jgi:ABC-2 type transport system ATP-binding protein